MNETKLCYATIRLLTKALKIIFIFIFLNKNLPKYFSFVEFLVFFFFKFAREFNLK